MLRADVVVMKGQEVERLYISVKQEPWSTKREVVELGRWKNIKVRRDPEWSGRNCGIAESDEGETDAGNLWGTILHCGEIFPPSSPKGNFGIGGEYLDRFRYRSLGGWMNYCYDRKTSR